MDWIQDGLEFQCTRCGECCVGPGYVWLNEEEIRQIAERLEMDVDAFGEQYLIRVGKRYSLKEGTEHRCILLGEDNRCSVYDIRPRQCRTFPFWPMNLKSRSDWEEPKTYCPGIDQGRLYTVEEIREIMKTHRST